MITSAQNPKIQWIRGLMSRRQEREKEKVFLVEGVRLAEEAAAKQLSTRLVLYSSVLSARGLDLLPKFRAAGVEVEEVTPRLMDSIAGTDSPQGILLVMEHFELPLPHPLNFIVIADQLRDPGNLGTLLRTAAAAGVQAFFATPGTTDPFSPKVLRSGMGAHFRLPVYQRTWEEIAALSAPDGKTELPLLLADAEQGVPCWDLDLTSPVGIVVGGEADGVSSEARGRVSRFVSIPMPGDSESLNAAIAAGILLFEVVRQRR